MISKSKRSPKTTSPTSISVGTSRVSLTKKAPTTKSKRGTTSTTTTTPTVQQQHTSRSQSRFSSTPSSGSSQKFKPSQLVMSLRSNSPPPNETEPAYIESILDRATRGGGTMRSSTLVCSERPRLKGSLMVCDAGTQTTEVWNPNNFTLLQNKIDHEDSRPFKFQQEKFLHANFTAGSLLGESRSIGIDPEKMINDYLIPDHFSRSIISQSSPISNKSNVFRADPPMGCVKPTPIRLMTVFCNPLTPVSEKLSFSCASSEDGTSTSSASSYSTFPSSISSPDAAKIANLNIHEKSAFIWSTNQPSFLY